MCREVLFALPWGCDLDAADALLDEHGWARHAPSHPLEHPGLATDPTLFRLENSHCDCDHAIGAAPEMTGKTKVRRRAEDRLRAKGWSDARIARWREQKDGHAKSKQPDAKPFVDLLLAMRALPRTPWVKVANLWNGSEGYEPIAVQRAFTRETLTPGDLLALPTGSLLAVR